MFMVYLDYHNRSRFSYKESSFYITRVQQGRKKRRRGKSIYDLIMYYCFYFAKTIVTSVNILFPISWEQDHWHRASALCWNCAAAAAV